MASPQLENGHMKLANEIVQALTRVNLSSGYEWRVLMCILRKTYGWNKKRDEISLSQIADMTGIAKPHVCRSVKGLLSKHILLKSARQIGLNKNYEQWPITKSGNAKVTKSGNKSLPNMVTTVTKSGNKSLPNPAPQKTIKTLLQKTTTQKKSPLFQIFNFWNEKGKLSSEDKVGGKEKIIWHSHRLKLDGSMSSDVEYAIKAALSKFSVVQVCGAIDNYAKILLSTEYFWEHVWPLSTFLTVGEERHKSAPRKWHRFLPDNFVAEHYLTESAKKKRSAKEQGPNFYEIEKAKAEKRKGKINEQQTA